jgi:hypothetical protein
VALGFADELLARAAESAPAVVIADEEQAGHENDETRRRPPAARPSSPVQVGFRGRPPEALRKRWRLSREMPRVCRGRRSAQLEGQLKANQRALTRSLSGGTRSISRRILPNERCHSASSLCTCSRTVASTVVVDTQPVAWSLPLVVMAACQHYHTRSPARIPTEEDLAGFVGVVGL